MGSSRIALALVVLAAALTGCTSPFGQPELQGDPIMMGAPLALTGSLAEEGQTAEEGYYFCRDWVNAKGGLHVGGVWHPLVIRLRDDQSRVSVSAQQTEQLISEEHANLLLGPVGNPAADADATVAEARHVPILLTSNAESTFNRNLQYVFGVASPASHYLRGVIDMALTLTPTPQSAAIIFANDTLSIEIANDLKAYAGAKGVSVVYFSKYPSGTNDLRTRMAGIASAAPDLVFQIGHPSETIVSLEEGRQLNVHPLLLAFTTGSESPGFLSDLKQTGESVYAATAWTADARFPINYFIDGKTYAAQYTAAYGHPPNPTSAAATAACVSLGAAVERAGSTDAPAVRDALRTLDLKTFYGEIRFDRRGLNVFKPMEVVQIQNGSPVVVWPPAQATARPRYPMP